MDHTSTATLGLAPLAAAIAAGEVSSTEAVTQALARIDASQSSLNAFRLVRAEKACAEANEADRRLARGERLPLLGVPVAVKDDSDVAGEPTAFGCAGDFPAKQDDCTAVANLRAAGAIIVGKTNTCELGLWPLTHGDAFGYTRNPWASERTPGGSSGGTAAAVAAGLVPAALGSDGAGSVRIPASWTNLVGIKPQRGRIPLTPLPEGKAFYGLCVYGPLARTVADAALLLDVASGTSATPNSVVNALEKDPGRLRIALATRAPFVATRTTLDPDVRAGVERIATTLRKLGHEVTVADPPYTPLIGLSFLPRAWVGTDDWVREAPRPELLDHRTRATAHEGRLTRGLPLRGALALERFFQRRIGAMFNDFDVVLAPTTATPPMPIDAIDGHGAWDTNGEITRACPYTWPWNVLGWPSVNVPAGFTSAGLPVGAQLMGNAHSEPLLVSVAAQLEAELRWDLQRPEPWWES